MTNRRKYSKMTLQFRPDVMGAMTPTDAVIFMTHIVESKATVSFHLGHLLRMLLEILSLQNSNNIDIALADKDRVEDLKHTLLCKLMTHVECLDTIGSYNGAQISLFMKKYNELFNEWPYEWVHLQYDALLVQMNNESRVLHDISRRGVDEHTIHALSECIDSPRFSGGDSDTDDAEQCELLDKYLSGDVKKIDEDSIESLMRYYESIDAYLHSVHKQVASG